MKKTYLLLVVFCTLSIISCQKIDNQDFYNLKNNEIVLQERDQNSPLILSNRTQISSKRLKSTTSIPFENYLGRSYKDNEIPIGSAENIFFPIIDINKIIEEHPLYIFEKRIGKSEAECFSFSDFNRYTKNSTVTKKVNGGISLNLGLFSLGAKAKMEKIYTTSKVQENKRIYGELNILVKDRAYMMQSSSNIKKIMTLNYLTSEFRNELYNTTPSELFQNYGGFVLAGFSVGGRATALYSGIYNENTSNETKEKNMNADISASYGFKSKSGSDNKISADLGIGKAFNNSSSFTKKIEGLEVSIKTLGGNLLFSSFTIPQNINTINIDLSQWIASLNDKNSHSIIDILDDGLIPIPEFIMEENLKRQFVNQYNQSIISTTTLQEPTLEIVSCSNSEIAFLTIYLTTRFGDKIALDSYSFPSEIPLDSFIQEFKNKKTNIYGLKTIYKHLEIPIPSVYYEFNFYGIDESKMKKFTDNKTKTIYLLYSDKGKKYAYSIHDDYIVDTYAIRSLVNNLPTIQIDPNLLFDYTIIAL